MTLANLIRKRHTKSIATATPATFATRRGGGGGIVARVATVAVANSKEGQTHAPVTVADKATFFRWHIHFVDREPLEVGTVPFSTHAEILAQYPYAVAAEPFTPTIRQSSAPMTAEEETAIRAWLALIEETDPATIAEVIGQCQRDADARDYFTRRAAELPKPDPFPDDRRTCSQCRNLRQRVCAIAKPERGALVVANRGYRPDPARLLRCEGYAALESDADQRTGAERWPGLFQKGGE